MTVGGVPVGAVGAVIPAFAGMTLGGVPAGAVRTIIPAFAGMTLMVRLWPGVLALALLASIVAGALGALLTAAPDIDLGTLASDRYLRRVVAFTFWQALLSAALSTGLAIPVARALARREGLPGRAWLLKLVGLPLVVPSIVAVFGIVAVYGHSGWINDLASLLGAPRWTNLYGLWGILLAHVFFNLPLAVRLLLPLWSAVPGETWRLVSQLGMPSGAIWRLIEWPLLRQALPGVAGLVFMLCFTSFAVVLTLGGGPAASTVEVAIYQALRFDFDPARAVFLALLELTCCALLVGFGQRLVVAMPSEVTPGRTHPRPDTGGRAGRIADAVLILAIAAFVALPLAAVAVAGLAGPVGKVLGDGLFWACAARSLVIALCAAPLALALGWSLLAMCRRLRLRHRMPGWADGVELSGSLVIVVPPIVLGTGFFILLSPHVDVYVAGPPLVVMANALMGVPYVLRVLGPLHRQMSTRYEHLCENLGLGGLPRLRLVEAPLLRRPLGLALGLCAAISVGDLGVIALFGTRDNATLPLLLYQKMASYRMDEAAVIALFLIVMCLGLFAALERLVGGRS